MQLLYHAALAEKRSEANEWADFGYFIFFLLEKANNLILFPSGTEQC